MGENILRFAPTAQALENIPHMLRYWADAIERDEANGINAEIGALVLINSGDPTPAFFIAGGQVGQPPHPLYVAGIFDYCRQQMLTVVEK